MRPLMLLSLLCVITSGSWPEAVGPNLVANPGFETVDARGVPEHWPLDGTVYTCVTSPVHSGGRAVQYVNDDPGRYILCPQKIPLQPGKAYEVSVWIKTENLQGEEMGATICLEWQGPDGKWLGGFYPAGFKGDTDWKQLKVVSPRIPREATGCTVLCYVRRGMTGKAWFDDVEVRQWVGPPLHTMLLSPNYRGELQPGTQRIEAHATLVLDDYDLKPGDVYVCTDLIRKLDSKVVDQRRWIPQGPEVYLPVRASGLEPGQYELRISVLRRHDRGLLGSECWRLNVVRPEKLRGRTSYIDQHNRLIRHGRPFFPLGMYWSSINEADIKLYADSPFNCLMPYGMPSREQMDLAHKYGLKVIYSVKDIYYGSTYCPEGIKTIEDERRFIEAKTAEFREHPALLAWYLNDELPVEYMDRLEAHQQWLEELDPNHPTWVVLYQVGELAQYVRTCDAIGTDPYPIPGEGTRRAGDWAGRTVAAVRDRRPVWMVPQVFNWACYRQSEESKAGLRPPTLDEMRSMAWQCIVHGAKGLIFYSFFDLKRDTVVPFDKQWPAVKQMAQEIKEMIPVILSPECAPRVQATARPWLHWTTRKLGEDVYLIAVNDEGRPHHATFALSACVGSLEQLGITATAQLRDGKLHVKLAPHGVGIWRMRK